MFNRFHSSVNQICDLIQTIWDHSGCYCKVSFQLPFFLNFGWQLPQINDLVLATARKACSCFLCRWYPGSQPEHSSDQPDPQWKRGWKDGRIDHFSDVWGDQKSGEKTRLRLLDVASLSHFFTGFVRCQVVFRISSINSKVSFWMLHSSLFCHKIPKTQVCHSEKCDQFDRFFQSPQVVWVKYDILWVLDSSINISIQHSFVTIPESQRTFTIASCLQHSSLSPD